MVDALIKGLQVEYIYIYNYYIFGSGLKLSITHISSYLALMY